MFSPSRTLAAMLVLAAAVAGIPAALPAPSARAAVPTRKPMDGLLGNFSLARSNEPISVRAANLEFSYRERILTYTGGVVVTQCDLTLRADKLTVTLNEDTSGADALRELRADGNVEISKGTRSATGGQAVYDQRDRTMKLSDNAVLIDGPNRIRGDRVIVYLDEERSVIEGGTEPVQAILYPNTLKGAGEEGQP